MSTPTTETPTIITIQAERDCQGDKTFPVDIEIREDLITIDTIDPTDPANEGDRVHLPIDAIHQALLEKGLHGASPQLNGLLAILSPKHDELPW